MFAEGLGTKFRVLFVISLVSFTVHLSSYCPIYQQFNVTNLLLVGTYVFMVNIKWKSQQMVALKVMNLLCT